ncbi:hypothetical protein EII34_14950 [Arachnia propionica]|uniref:Uncharacterized protein n=1 Tax=Arachnia propionica TaxID=1750 RepID=A0A3P1T3X7_9ACTN|nr:hypothetical protein [Arachnia propionica]RRD03203.1 hypothetical protein EII34_14950 [Arachnia propionica]
MDTAIRYDLSNDCDVYEALTDLDRAVEALREIRDMHVQVVDGPRLICGRCGHLWPCEHASVLRDVEDLL